jgi:phosphoglycolate phosphatase-like HAD superfamily hydrolase
MDEILELIPEIALSKDDFLHLWRAKIETQEALKLDTLHPERLRVLEEVSGNANVYLCTARQDEANLNNQLEMLGISKFFTQVLVTKQVKSKFNVVKSFFENSYMFLKEDDWFVGDTLEDISTGRYLGMQTCGVLSGLTSQENFNAMTPPPNIVLKDIVDFAEVLRSP